MANPPHRLPGIESQPEAESQLDRIVELARSAGMLAEVTGAHVVRVRRLVELLALRLGQPPITAEQMGYHAMLHDVGRIALPPALRQLIDPRTDEERRAVRSHTILGYRMLAVDDQLMAAAQIARSHHESWDGTGYPEGLSGDSIPLAARLTAVADALDELVRRVPEPRRRTLEAAVEEITALAGASFDPEITGALRGAYEEGELLEVYDTPSAPADAA